MKNFKWLFLLITYGFFTIGCTKIQDSFIHATLDEFGLYEVTREAPIVAPGTSAGYVNPISSQKLLSKTDQVPSKLNTTFGIAYTVRGLPVDREITVTVRLIHPPLKNPATGITSTVDEDFVPLWTSGESYYFFTFDDPWEAVPGPWTYQVVYDGKVLLEKSFEVLP